MNILLWIIQVLLALLFVFGGVMKLLVPAPPEIGFPDWFLKFIGLCELLGGLGLVLPSVFRRQQFLTPLAAIGLTIIMIGAVAFTVKAFGFMPSITPLITGLLCLFVAYGRWKVRPLQYSFT
jgi:uncharacterized membrane protein YphA (DoxX/SURF4 family)